MLREPVAQGGSGGAGALRQALPCLHCTSQAATEVSGHFEDLSPEHHSVVGVADSGKAGHSPLRCKAGLHEGPRVEHAQEPVDDDLGDTVGTRLPS